MDGNQENEVSSLINSILPHDGPLIGNDRLQTLLIG